MSASQVAQVCQGQWHGEPPAAIGPDVVFDSRQVTPGALFVALPGERVDGHDFLASAREAGAAAALVTRPVDDPLPQLQVNDGIAALTALATSVAATERERGLVTIGITGSSGKTTTKDLVAHILESQGPTVSPAGSFNNELGMPITTLRVDESTRWFVCEMGAQHAGDIRFLCQIAAPQVGVVLNVGHAHLGEFGSVEGIVQAKGELVEALDSEGFAVLNADDPRVWSMRERTQATVIATALGDRPAHHPAVWAADVTTDALGRCAFTLCSDLSGSEQSARVSLQMPGRHIAADAVAAAAASLAAGVGLDQVAAGLSSATPRSRWRMAMSDLPSGALLVNDAYNANPDSVAASLAAVASLVQHRREEHPDARSWVVLGDMLELGPESDHWHREIGRLAADADEVIAVGDFAHLVVEGAGRGRALPDAAAAGRVLATEVSSADIVLLKGSNATGLGALGDALVAGLNGEQQ